MLKFLERIKFVSKSFIRILTLQDLRAYFNKTHYAFLSVSLLINVASSLSRLIAPAAFGKALEMLAKSQKETSFADLDFSPLELLYLSISLSIWLRYEDDIKELVMLPFVNTLTEKMSLNLSRHAHELPLNEHTKIRNEINS